MESVINAIGLTSSILITVMFVPQVVHVYRTKDTHAIDYAFLFLNMLASSLGLVYSVYFNVIPMIVANTSAGLFSVTLASMKFLNGLKEEVSNDTISEAPIV
jgi:uncharacterized protein with PQ loop repeat